MAHCPTCLGCRFEATTFSVDLDEVLHRWEEAAKIHFPDCVWQDYAEASKSPIRHLRCGDCGFGRFEPVVTGTAAFYEAVSDHDYYVDDKWEFAQAIADIRRAGARSLLDIGCGSGHFLRRLRREEPGIASTGQEIFATPLAVLGAEGFATLSGSPQKLAANWSEEDRFESVTMFQVLEHAGDPWALLAASAALLVPGGSFIVSTPDADGPIARFKDALTEIPPHHVTQWTEAAYRACLPRFGFEIVRVRREPLPHYLWDTYLPALWDDGIWPAQLLNGLANEHGADRKTQLDFAARVMRKTGISHLHGVPGHTIYVLARRRP